VAELEEGEALKGEADEEMAVISSEVEIRSDHCPQGQAWGRTFLISYLPSCQIPLEIR
jgi:hypothetical protein